MKKKTYNPKRQSNEAYLKAKKIVAESFKNRKIKVSKDKAEKPEKLTEKSNKDK